MANKLNATKSKIIKSTNISGNLCKTYVNVYIDDKMSPVVRIRTLKLLEKNVDVDLLNRTGHRVLTIYKDKTLVENSIAIRLETFGEIVNALNELSIGK